MTYISFNFPMLTIVLSMMCAAATSAVHSKRAARIISLSLLAVVVVLTAFTLRDVLAFGDTVTYKMGQASAPWGNELRFGPMELGMSLAFSCVLLLTIFGGQKYFELDISDHKTNLYYVMVDLTQAALLALAYTNDVFTAFVFVEICTIASAGLLMSKRIGRTTLASVRYLIFSLVGSGLFLMGVVLLYGVTGHLLMPYLRPAVESLWATGQYRLPLVVIITLISMGLSIKSGLWPFHLWMPDTYSYTSPGSSGVLSGLISKIYILLLIKFIYQVIGPDVYYASGVGNILFLLGLAGMFFGSVSAIRENDVRRMLAFSSAAQIGYIFMGIGLSPVLGIAAALFHMLAHALTKPLLFLSAADLAEAGGGVTFEKLQNTAYRVPLAGLGFLAGSLSMVGIPFFIGFIAKVQLASAAVLSGWMMLPALVMLAVSTILNTMYFLRTVLRIYSPKPVPPEHGPAREAGLPPMLPEPVEKIKAHPCFAVSAVLFIVGNIALGVCAQPIITLLQQGLALLGGAA